MEFITLTGTDITAGKIALGTATFGLNIEENECTKIMNEYLENGGSIIDTALVYTDWAPGERSRSEKIIGRWIIIISGIAASAFSALKFPVTEDKNEL